MGRDWGGEGELAVEALESIEVDEVESEVESSDDDETVLEDSETGVDVPRLVWLLCGVDVAIVDVPEGEVSQGFLDFAQQGLALAFFSKNSFVGLMG